MLQFQNFKNILKEVNDNKETSYQNFIEMLKKKLKEQLVESEYKGWESSTFSKDFEFRLLNNKEEKKYTLLYITVTAGYEKIVGFFLKNIACVNRQNSDGNTLLHLAVMNGHKGIVGRLLGAQALINIKNNTGEIPLHLAVSKMRVEIVDLLTKSGVGINAQNAQGNTPLHIAVLQGNKGIFEKLLGAKALIDVQNNENDTPLHLAVKNKYKDIFEKLLKAEARIDIQNIEGNTPLHIAVLQGNKGIFEKLLGAKALIDVQNIESDTPLHLAVKNENKDVVEKLFKAEARIDIQNIEGDTPLHLAVKKEYKDIIEKLLKKNPEIINIPNKHGKTALDIAIEQKHNTIIKSLKNNGAQQGKSSTSEERHVCSQKQKMPQSGNASASTVKKETVEPKGDVKQSFSATFHISGDGAKDTLQSIHHEKEICQVKNQGVPNKREDHMQQLGNASASTSVSEKLQPKVLKLENALDAVAQPNAAVENICTKESTGSAQKKTYQQTLNPEELSQSTTNQSREDSNCLSLDLLKQIQKTREELRVLSTEFSNFKQRSGKLINQELNAKITQLQKDLENEILKLVTREKLCKKPEAALKLLEKNNTKSKEEDKELIQKPTEINQQLERRKEQNEESLKRSDDTKQALEKMIQENHEKIIQLQKDLDDKTLDLSRVKELYRTQENTRIKQRNTIATVTGATVVTPLTLIYLTALSTLAIAGITLTATLAAGLLVNKISSKLSEADYTSVEFLKQQHV